MLSYGPWTYESRLLITSWVTKEDNVHTLPLNTMQIWVQVLDLPSGFMSKTITVIIGNSIGSFISVDPNNFSGYWNSYMWIRVGIDVRRPIRSSIRLCHSGGEWFRSRLRYDRLSRVFLWYANPWGTFL